MDPVLNYLKHSLNGPGLPGYIRDRNKKFLFSAQESGENHLLYKETEEEREGELSSNFSGRL